MKKCINFEFLKLRKSKLLIFMIVLLTSIILFSSLYSHFKESDFVQEQHAEARIMIDTIDESHQNIEEEGLKREKDLYMRLLLTETWKDTYYVLNEIDELFVENPDLVEKNQSDLPYDYKENIEIRNYNLKYNISPNEKSAILITYNLFENLLNFLIPIIVLLVGVYMFFNEYDNNEIYYLYGLNFSYRKIILSKLILSWLTSLIIILVPLIISFLVIFFIDGFGNVNRLVEVSHHFGTVFVGNISFITIGYYFSYLIVIMFLSFVLINSIVCLFSVLSVKKLYGGCIAFGVVVILFRNKYLVAQGRTFLSRISFPLQYITGLFISILLLEMTICYLKNRDII